MKYEILKSFRGSQDGRFTEEFKAGEIRELSDHLVSCVAPGAVRPVAPEKAPGATLENKAISSDGSQTGVLANVAKSLRRNRK